MSDTEKNMRELGWTIFVWLLKGLCIGFGACAAWRFCHVG